MKPTYTVKAADRWIPSLAIMVGSFFGALTKGPHEFTEKRLHNLNILLWLAESTFLGRMTSTDINTSPPVAGLCY